jgi:hypothetical protein
MFWSTVGRMIVVPVAFVLAMSVAILVLLSIGYERIVHAMAGSSGVDSFETIFGIVGSGALIASAMTMLPALTLVVVGEVARIRSALYYILGGGASLAVIPLLARLGQQPEQAAAATALWQVFATAGFAGGLVYWLLAGRRA